MKIALLAVLVAAAHASNERDRMYYEEKFYNWLSFFKMTPPTGMHFVRWLQNFANNDDIIVAHNLKKLSYTLGHNQFSHMTYEQWRAAVHFGYDRSSLDNSTAGSVHKAPVDLRSLPAEVDWVAKGGVTPVKDQGQCGSCWSFSTTGAIEGAYYAKYGTLVSFSEQNLVDCDTARHGGKDSGCNGGLMDNAFEFIEFNGGLCTEEDYPYVSGSTKREGTCHQKSCKKVSNASPQSYSDVEVNSEAALMSALTSQPVAVAIEADQPGFQLYKSGVYTAKCGTNLDHGVLVVGYGTWTDGTPYWKVKNSWSAQWGMDGYILLERGVDQEGGQCGILDGASYPVL